MGGTDFCQNKAWALCKSPVSKAEGTITMQIGLLSFIMLAARLASDSTNKRSSEERKNNPAPFHWPGYTPVWLIDPVITHL